MAASGVGYRHTPVTIALTALLITPAGAARSYGESTTTAPPLALSAPDQLRPVSAPAPLDPGALSRTSVPSVVRVGWYDTGQYFHSDFDLVAEHVSACFRRAGVALIWRRGEIGASTEDVAADEVPVLLSASDVPPRRGARPVLGTTTTNDKGPRVVYVFVDAIRGVLNPRTSTDALTPAEARQLARSVARVIVHELMHALAPRQTHRTGGLMKQSLSRADLLAPLSARDARTVRAGLVAAGNSATAAAPLRARADRRGPAPQASSAPGGGV